jgi:hypothetical protein
MKATKFVIFALLLFATGSLFAQTQTPRVDKREANQEARIKQGVKSGELTEGEAKKLKRQQNKIQRHEMKAKSDGVVTPGEKAKLHREQKRASKNIYRKKNNNRDKQ